MPKLQSAKSGASCKVWRSGTSHPRQKWSVQQSKVMSYPSSHGISFASGSRKVPGWCPDCMTGEANDAVSAVSARTLVHLPEASRLLRLSENECPQVRTRLPSSRRPQRWDSIEDAVVPLERKTSWSPIGRNCSKKKKIGRSTNEKQLGKGTNVAVSARPPKITTVLVRKMWTDIKICGQGKCGNSLWNVLRQEIDLEDRTPLLFQIHLGSQRGGHGRTRREICLKVLRACWENHMRSKAGGNTVHGFSLAD